MPQIPHIAWHDRRHGFGNGEGGSPGDCRRIRLTIRLRSLSPLSTLRRFRYLWPLLRPLHAYVSPPGPRRGKGFLLERVLLPMIPTDPRASFVARLPDGGRLRLRCREVIGFEIMLHGAFEAAESRYLSSRARAGTTAIDVGANIGLFTVPLARAVGSGGRVLAIEPDPENVARLEANLRLNRLANVLVERVAASDWDGEAELHVANDPAFHSTVAVHEGREVGRSLRVPVTRLDTMWMRLGRPAVSAIKIDVEGAELAVLRGAETLLRETRPALLLEANTAEQGRALADWLAQRSYAWRAEPGLAKRSNAFEPTGGPRLPRLP
jgi:FkbM family methyltransferase